MIPDQVSDRTAQGQWAQGNRASMTHGLFAVGGLPRGCSYIRRLTSQFRGKLEATVRERQGEISLHSAALICAAVRHAQRQLLLQRWLRLEGDRLALGDWLALVREIGVAADSVVRCFVRLKLDKSAQEAVWDSYFAGGKNGHDS
jgi:hypothetical protein